MLHGWMLWRHVVPGSPGSGAGIRAGPAMRITHHLEISNDFLFRWQYQDSKGRAVGGVLFDQVYEEADLSGLW